MYSETFPSAYCTLSFSGIGRHFVTDVHLDVIKYLEENIQDKEFQGFLLKRKSDLLRTDGHETERMVDRAYKAMREREEERPTKL